ncbi:hypothetical protein K1X76_09160 [bacterium]|nr:hypothetical protein [bacterium]
MTSSAPQNFKPVNIDKKQIALFYKLALEKLGVAQDLASKNPDIAYEILYESALQACLALLHAHGLRPRAQPGHHIAIIEKSKELLKQEVDDDFFEVMQLMRKTRNTMLYDAVLPVSHDEFKEMRAQVKIFLELICKKLPK